MLKSFFAYFKCSMKSTLKFLKIEFTETENSKNLYFLFSLILNYFISDEEDFVLVNRKQNKVQTQFVTVHWCSRSLHIYLKTSLRTKISGMHVTSHFEANRTGGKGIGRWVKGGFDFDSEIRNWESQCEMVGLWG